MSRANLNDLIDKADEKVYVPKASRSVSNHGRNTSGTRTRSKIPTIVTQNTAAADISEMSTGKEMTASSPTIWGNRSRMTSRSFNSSTSKTRAGSIHSANQRILERLYKNKQNRYMSIRNEIQEKQLSALNMYEEVSQLREKIIAGGGKDPGKIESIKTQSTDFPIKYNDNDCEVTRRASEEYISFSLSTPSIDKDAVFLLMNGLENYPNGYLSFTEEIIEEYSKLIQLINNLNENNNSLDKFTDESFNFKLRLEMTKESIDKFKNESINKVKIMWEEIRALRSEIQELKAVSNKTANKLKEKNVEAEEKFNQLRETKDVTDNDLRKTKAVILELEARIHNDEIKLNKFQAYVKALENQIQQNNKIFENSTRDLNNSLKNAEETIGNLENQRSVFELNLIELQDKLKEVENERDRSIEEARKRIEEDAERNKSCQVEKLNCEIESLNKELINYKDLISGINEQKLLSDNDFKCQLEEERARLKDLTRNYQALEETFHITEEKMIDLEKQVASIYSSDVPNNDFDAFKVLKINEELGQEITDLRRKNIELDTSLTEAVNKFHQQAEQIRVQDQMIAYLKNNNHGVNDQEVSKEICNSEAIQKLYEIVETKELQLSRLEKLVKQMEDQEERAQEQRTRLERRIAQLELALQTKNSKEPRYVSLEDCRDYREFLEHHTRPRTPEYVYNTRMVQEEVARTLELERKYQKYKQKSESIECYYNWLIKSPNLRINDGSNSRNRYSHPLVPHIDVSSYAYQVVDNCAREFKTLNLHCRHKSSRSNSSRSKSRDCSF